jgi:RecB family exonuclease/inactivated superfamily I helicase
VITPRRTRLVRVPDLQTFRRAIAALCPTEAGSSKTDARAIIVPTRAAARLLSRFMLRTSRADQPPDILTRAELYDSLHARLARPPRRLSAFERDAIAQAAARQAAAAEPSLAFRLRPGLVAEMIRFYDQLRRQSQQVNRFEELIAGPLGGAADDRGAGRLLVQTRFLARAFREYERRAEETGAVDEHALRVCLLRDPFARPLRHVVVTVADWIADRDGLWVADFDLLSRLPDLESIDLVCTDATLGSGMHERIHSWWPGLEEIEAATLLGPERAVRPTLLTSFDVRQSGSEPRNETWFTFRDREEELVAAARRYVANSQAHTAAVVFKQPLPYLYLAPDALGSAGVPYETFDALPLAAEPTASAVDAVLDVVESGFTRSALVALLRSPHFAFVHDGVTLSREAVGALDGALVGARYLGDIVRLERIHAEREGKLPALDVALAVARQLAPLGEAAPASAQVRRLLAFLADRFRPLDVADPFDTREKQARAAIVEVLTSLAAAHLAFHDPDWTIAELAPAVRRWISEQTFSPHSPELAGPGISLVDDQAARYGDFDDITVVGLVENEWPERPRRNIFYGAALLKALGWPSEKDRQGAADARFLDLISSASTRVILSTFTLDDEMLVTRSTQLDEVPRARLSSVPLAPKDAGTADGEPSAGEWTDIRTGRLQPDADVFHGRIGPQPARPWSISALETYIGCPFKFFAQHVLRLQEEPDDEEVMDPRRQGQFVHDVFEQFFAEWQRSGRRAITPDNLADARALFVDVVERALVRLPDAEGGLERTRLLGSSAAAGLGEAVFRMEAERPTAVVERLLEERLDGEFVIHTEAGMRTVRLRGKADRLDLLDDGTFRLIDYKLGWPPNKARALQLPIYSLCAEQKLAARSTGRTWTLGEAAYLAFKGPRRVVPLFSNPAERDEVLAKAQQRLADTLDGIERGEFPPTPDDVFRCETCSFAAVCRKDYV